MGMSSSALITLCHAYGFIPDSYYPLCSYHPKYAMHILLQCPAFLPLA